VAQYPASIPGLAPTSATATVQAAAVSRFAYFSAPLLESWYTIHTVPSEAMAIEAYFPASPGLSPFSSG
jgi:hypothetical protein